MRTVNRTSSPHTIPTQRSFATKKSRASELVTAFFCQCSLYTAQDNRSGACDKLWTRRSDVTLNNEQSRIICNHDGDDKLLDMNSREASESLSKQREMALDVTMHNWRRSKKLASVQIKNDRYPCWWTFWMTYPSMTSWNPLYEVGK